MTDTLPDGVEILRPIDGRYASVLTSGALAFVADLQRRLGPGRQRILAARAERWARLRAGEQTTPIILLGLAREDRPAGRYYEMKVVDGRSGSALWTYDGSGSDYVAAAVPGAHGEGRGGGEAGGAWFQSTRPQLRDVDGDDSDDVVFVEQDFVFGTLLRAVRIEP